MPRSLPIPRSSRVQASTAFLKGRDSLRRPIGEILANLDAIAEVFPTRDDPRPLRPRDLPADRPSLSGVDVACEFWQDGDALPDAAGWLALAGRRVRRVTATFGVMDDRGDASPSIGYAKEAGIAVSVVLICGPDDPARIARMADAVNALALGRGDFVHLMGGIRGDSWQDAEMSRQFDAAHGDAHPRGVGCSEGERLQSAQAVELDGISRS